MNLVGKIVIPVAVKNYQDLPAKKSTAMQTSIQLHLKKSADNGANITWSIVIKPSI